MPESIEFGKFVVGNKSPAFVIAEVGVNHNGDLNLAKDLIYKAAECGANCVKFQTFKAERVVLADAPKAHYQLKTTDAGESQLQMLKKLELIKDNQLRTAGLIFALLGFVIIYYSKS